MLFGFLSRTSFSFLGRSSKNSIEDYGLLPDLLDDMKYMGKMGEKIIF